AFLDSIAPWARQAARQLGVAPELVQAHAALESGWGQRPLRTADGASSHNLFGIKAGAGWEGAAGESTTTEYVNGAALKTRERFRAYPDAASAFQDYARVLTDNPRYRAALNTGNDAQAFAQGLARGGYATDPGYAAKLARIAASLQGNQE
ncbi:Mannosyl-glycoprotein endo-beta-N-acetylglucosaminidase, partial [Friedmanniomyces endolithicus]